jgi:hypothetical protein
LWADYPDGFCAHPGNIPNNVNPVFSFRVAQLKPSSPMIKPPLIVKNLCG